MDDRWKKKEYLDLIDDDIERKLAEKLKLCYIEGKKKNKNKNHVPILFPEECVKAIQRMVSIRERFVEEENDYVFHTGELYIKGWHALQSVAKKMGDRLKSPKLLTPTRTRKFLATILQLMQLNDAELGWMTAHMGHTKDVHLGFYRQEDSTIELTKVAKVFICLTSFILPLLVLSKFKSDRQTWMIVTFLLCEKCIRAFEWILNHTDS